MQQLLGQWCELLNPCSTISVEDLLAGNVCSSTDSSKDEDDIDSLISEISRLKVTDLRKQKCICDSQHDCKASYLRSHSSRLFDLLSKSSLEHRFKGFRSKGRKCRKWAGIGQECWKCVEMSRK